MPNSNGPYLYSGLPKADPKGRPARLRAEPIKAAANTNVTYLDHYRTLDSQDDFSERVGGNKAMATEGELRAAEIAASEARTETKLARFEGKLDLVLSKLDANSAENAVIRLEIADSRRAVIQNGWVICAVVVAVLAILSAVTPVVFDMGYKVRETISKDIDEKVKATQRPATSQ